MQRHSGFTLIELMVVIAIIAVIAAVAIPGITAALRAANENNAVASLKTINTGNVTFRGEDGDGNNISDYWVDDVAGLYYTSPFDPPTVGSEVKLIELSVAIADGDTIQAYSLPSGGIHQSSTKAGYWYFAMEDFEISSGVTQAFIDSRESRFGFMCVPGSYGATAKNVFMTNETFVALRKDPTTLAAYMATPPQLGVQDTDGALTDLYDTVPIDPFAGDTATAAGNWGTLD